MINDLCAVLQQDTIHEIDTNFYAIQVTYSFAAFPSLLLSHCGPFLSLASSRHYSQTVTATKRRRFHFAVLYVCINLAKP